MTTYDEADMEAAMCLWEAVLEEREDYKDTFEAVGTCEVRTQIVYTVKASQDLWVWMQERGLEIEPYDWEFCPWFIKEFLVWDEGGVRVDTRLIELFKTAHGEKV
jgi:hypothetical protein